MPYIKQERRQEIRYGEDGERIKSVEQIPRTPGELNFAICDLVDDYITEALGDQELDYELLNEVVGAVELAKLEIVRRLVTPYEKKKRRENGEVFVFTAP